MDGRFETTRWSLILAATSGESPESRNALEGLCQAYWFPVYAFIRRQGYPAEEARDLTQAYFARLIEHHDLKRVHPSLGRFRSFLLASCKHFLSNELDRARARKRSPEQPLVSLEAEEAESRYRLEPADEMTPEKVFERRWATTVLERTMDHLRQETAGGERTRRFEVFRAHLLGDLPEATYQELGASLGMTEDAIKMAIHRLRHRFGEVLREEIANTVREPRDIGEEIRYLIAALRA